MGIFSDGFVELKKASEPLYKAPKSIRETIEIMKVAENGIFERYCKFLNSMDCAFKIMVNNKNHNDIIEEKIREQEYEHEL